MISKATAEILLLRIANTILLNAGKVQTGGLLNGKMGIALFLYHYAEINGNKVYGDFADELLDEVLDGISSHTPSVDFAHGLTGIAWGICHLIEEKFIDADTDILEEMETLFGKTDHADLIADINNAPSFFSKGIYFTNRNNNEVLLHLLNELNSPLTQHDGILPLGYLNSILYTVLQVNINMETFTDLLHMLYTRLLDSIKGKHYTFPDVLILTNLVRQLKQRQNSNLEYKKWEPLVRMLNTDSLSGIFNMGIYDLVYDKLKSDESFILNKLETSDLEDQINAMIKDVYRNIGVYNGLAGAGLTFLNYFHKQNETI